MRTPHITTAAMFLMASIALAAQAPEPKLNMAIGEYVAAYKEGDVKKLLSYYERKAFICRPPGTVSRRGLRAALKAEFAYRGAPSEVEVDRELVQEGRGFMVLHLKWESGYSTHEMQFWILANHRWKITANRRHAQNPDRQVWIEYQAILKAALADQPPSKEEVAHLVDLSKTAMTKLYENNCDWVMNYVAPYKDISVFLGWDLRVQAKEWCQEVWCPGPLEVSFGATFEWKNTRAEWKPRSLKVDTIPGQADVTKGKPLCCVEIHVPYTTDAQQRNGYVIRWIRTVEGWRIWDIL